MSRTLTMIFDGEVFRPTEPVDLPADTEYRVTIEDEGANIAAEDDSPLMRYLKLAQPLGVTDLAEQHDHYARGTPKR
jgi:hypothetical protein